MKASYQRASQEEPSNDSEAGGLTQNKPRTALFVIAGAAFMTLPFIFFFTFGPSLPKHSMKKSHHEKPNLIFILPDQLRYDTQGLRQEERGVDKRSQVRTPNLDRLAMEGVSFRIAYTQAAVCVPARASILTGCTIERTGVRTNAQRTLEKIQASGSDAATKLGKLRTFDDILVNDHGYTAEYYGKWHSPESLGYVYSNDVRAAGVPEAWFNKSDSQGEPHNSRGMGTEFRKWLEENDITQKEPLEEGELLESMSRHAYVPDPLDARYGMPPDTPSNKVKPVKLQGRSRIPDGYSIVNHQARNTLEALERLHKASKPFSLTLSFQSPHPPLTPTDKYYDMYNPDDMEVPESLNDDMVNSPYLQRRVDLAMGGITNTSKVQRMRATYHGLVTEVDEHFGLILDKLDELGIAENTLVVFASDHGELLGSHGMASKSVFYEEAARVPLILRLPGEIPSGLLVDAPVTLIDLHSTILDYLRVGRKYKSDGATLRRFIESNDSKEDDSYLVTEWNDCKIKRGNKKRHCSSSEPVFMVRKGTWKLMMQRGKNDGLDMLFNLTEDPFEMQNLLGNNFARASDEVIGKTEHLKALLVKYLAKMNHPDRSSIAEPRDWSSTDCWVSDKVLDFRPLLQDGTRTEWIYVGTCSNQDLLASNVTMTGPDAASFSISLENGVSTNDPLVIAVTYSDSNGMCSSNKTASAMLELPAGVGHVNETFQVKLRGPPQGPFCPNN